MGKVRAKTLGDQEVEQKERDEAEARRQAKIATAKAEGKQAKIARLSTPDGVASGEQEVVKIAGEDKKDEESSEETKSVITSTEEVSTEKPSAAKKSAKAPKTGAKKERSEKYKEVAKLIEKGKAYSLSQALELLEKAHMAKFDETVELHINAVQSLSGSMNLPHGTGKSTRVAILAPAKDPKAAEDLLKEIESGKISFDVLIATPDAMPRLAKVARFLGPRGLMPNPKNGTVTPNPEVAAKQYEGGHMTYKTESKAPVLHLSVGKISFGKEKLEENIKVAFKAIEAKNMKKVTLKSTMSPALRISL